MLALQKKGKTIKEYSSAFEFAQELETVIAGAPDDWYESTRRFLNTHAFEMCMIGAKITLGNGYRLICLSTK